MRNRILILLALLVVPFFVFAGGGNEDDSSSQSSETAIQEEAPASGSGTPLGTVLDTSDPEKFVAVVNGVGILRSDYDMAIRRTQEAYMMQGNPIPESELPLLQSEMLNQLVSEELLYQEGLARGLAADPAMAELQYQQMRGQFPSDEAWANALATNETSDDELRSQIDRNNIVQQVLTIALENVDPVNQDEIQAFYDENQFYFQTGAQVSARHILISTEGLSSDAEITEARGRAESIREELLAGADFAQMAIDRSEGPSGPRGGDLGTFGPGQMVQPFDEAVFALEPGAISEVVQTQFGFHVIQVTEKMDAEVAPLEDVQPSIEQYLSQEKQGLAVEEYVNELREDASIVVN